MCREFVYKVVVVVVVVVVGVVVVVLVVLVVVGKIRTLQAILTLKWWW